MQYGGSKGCLAQIDQLSHDLRCAVEKDRQERLAGKNRMSGRGKISDKMHRIKVKGPRQEKNLLSSQEDPVR